MQGPFWLNNSVAIVKTLILTYSKISACFFVLFVFCCVFCFFFFPKGFTICHPLHLQIHLSSESATTTLFSPPPNFLRD